MYPLWRPGQDRGLVDLAGEISDWWQTYALFRRPRRTAADTDRAGECRARTGPGSGSAFRQRQAHRREIADESHGVDGQVRACLLCRAVRHACNFSARTSLGARGGAGSSGGYIRQQQRVDIEIACRSYLMRVVAQSIGWDGPDASAAGFEHRPDGVRTRDPHTGGSSPSSANGKSVGSDRFGSLA